jgi:muconolactone delta-isomerase
MQFLTVSRRVESAGAPGDALVRAEVQRALVLYAEGYMRQLWHRSDGPGACVLWEVEDDRQLWEMLKSLPLLQAGMVEVTVIPLRPWAGFAPESPANRPEENK